MPDLDLDALVLLKGSHGDRAEGVCLLEAAAWLAGRDHTDHPPCVSPVLGTFGRDLNDVLPDDTRQQLKQYLRPMLGTAGDGRDDARSYLALDWLIRVYLPAWLDLAGLADQATALRELAGITDMDTARSAGPLVRMAHDKAAAAGAAAGDAAWDAVGAAAWAAAGDAAGAAAWAAAGDAAWAAARAAARNAAWGKLAPTVAALQADAIRLFGAMIDA